MEILDKTPVGEFMPRFQETFLHREALRVVHPDHQTAVWLREKVNNLCKWEGSNLEVIKAKTLPKYVRVMAWLPGAPIETVTALKRLERQNFGLQRRGAPSAGSRRANRDDAQVPEHATLPGDGQGKL